MNKRIAGIASFPDERLQSLASQAALKGMANRGEDRFHDILARHDLPADVRPAALEWLQHQPAKKLPIVTTSRNPDCRAGFTD